MLLWYIWGMNRSPHAPNIIILIFGDLVTIIIVALIGFAEHENLAGSGTRPLAVVLSWFAAWALIGIHVGVFNLSYAGDGRQLWRPFWGMILASPLGALLRGLWLQANVIPFFVVVFGGFCAIGILAWRLLFWWVIRRRTGDG